MKKIIASALLTMTLSAVALAQRPKMTTQTAPAQSYSSSYSLRNSNELTALIGMAAGGINFGADYAHMLNNTWGAGGYFMMQTSKDKNAVPIVSQVMSFGGLLKINLVEANSMRVFIAPGFGISMVKDGSINASGSKSDETVLGPIFKMGVTYKVSSNFSIGLESTSLENFFNDNLNFYAGPPQYYAVALAFAF